MNRARALFAAWASAAALSCAARPAAPPASGTAFVRARPAPEPSPLAPAAASQAVPAAPATPTRREPAAPAREVVAGPPPVAPKAVPGRAPKTAPKPSPQQTAADATKKAAQAPDASDYFNAIVQYSYEPGSLYQVYAAPMHITDIALEPGEKILGDPASGDVVRWLLARGKSMVNGVDEAHVYLKPTRPDLETNLAINTDRRSYLLELHSYPDTYMAAIGWRYPEDELARLQAQENEAATEERAASPVVGLDSLNFHYTIQVVSGAPAWTPLQAFDDGKKTFVRFPPGMLLRESPALFILRDKQTELVNYRVKGDIYVVDRLLDAAELRVGQQDQEIVRILRGDPPPVRTLTRPIHGRY